MVRTDRKHLLQVLINLVSNAIKFTQQKGSIKLKVENVEGEPNKMHFSVSDSGIGIKANDRSKLFHLFGCIQDE